MRLRKHSDIIKGTYRISFKALVKGTCRISFKALVKGTYQISFKAFEFFIAFIAFRNESLKEKDSVIEHRCRINIELIIYSI